MSKPKTSRKRKRPSYLQDCYLSSSEEEEPVSLKKVQTAFNPADVFESSSEDDAVISDEKALPNNDLESSIEEERPTFFKTNVPNPSELFESSSEDEIIWKISAEKVESVASSKDELSDLLGTSSEEDMSNFGKKPAVLDQDCFLCGNILVTRCDMSDALLQASQYSYSDVLTKLLNKEQLSQSLAEKDCSHGVLCVGCKYLVEDLYRLQYQLREVKKKIVMLFEKSQHIEAEDICETKSKNNSDQSQCRKKANKATNDQEDKYKTPVKKPNDEVQIIESLKRKRGNKFLIKWENSPETENSWQPRSAIPDCIVQFYESDLTRLGSPLPSGGQQAVIYKGEDSQTRNIYEERTVDVDDSIEQVATHSEAKQDNKIHRLKESHVENNHQNKNSSESEKKADKRKIEIQKHLQIEKKQKNIELKSSTKGPCPKDEKKKKIIERENSEEIASATEEDEVYNIEALMEKSGSTYFVKWESYPESENTWEHKSSIPAAILQYYVEDLARLGEPVPVYQDNSDADEMKSDDSNDNSWETNGMKLSKKSTKIKSGTENAKTPKEKKTSLKLFQKTNEDVSKLNVHHAVESLLMKNGFKYLVKWKNCSNDENTWEHKTAIPKLVLKFYESDLTRLGSPLPSGGQQADKGETAQVENICETKKVDVDDNIDQVAMQLESKQDKKIHKLKQTEKELNLQNRYNSNSDKVKVTNEKKKDAGVHKITKHLEMKMEHEITELKERNIGQHTEDVEKIKQVEEGKPMVEIISDVKEDKVYNIEALMEKSGSNYFVKWENYPESENTWEHKSSIPCAILEYYVEDLARLGEPVPVYQVDENDEDEEITLDDSEEDSWEPFEKKVFKKPAKKKCDREAGKTRTPKENKKSLNQNQKQIKYVTKQNDSRSVESLLMKNGSKYLVKWLNCSEDENTWEHKTVIPKQVLKWYEESPSRLGSPAPGKESHS